MGKQKLNRPLSYKIQHALIYIAMRTVFIELIIIIDTHVHKRWIIFRFFVHLLFDIAVADDKTQINLRFISFAIRKIGAGINNYFLCWNFHEKN